MDPFGGQSVAEQEQAHPTGGSVRSPCGGQPPAARELPQQVLGARHVVEHEQAGSVRQAGKLVRQAAKRWEEATERVKQLEALFDATGRFRKPG